MINEAGSDLFVSAGLGLWVREAGGTHTLSLCCTRMLGLSSSGFSGFRVLFVLT